MGVSICQPVHTGYDLNFLCLKSEAYVLNHCKSKKEENGGDIQKGCESCVWSSPWVAGLAVIK
jgi:hypothetical protein